ncbi:hypothetical protein HMPREF0262_01615 [Clostridium sp. ATCC 29733]|nr:hypothetical protein HMPREF0262_01615 [Clostridium sp. ATCC 29733]
MRPAGRRERAPGETAGFLLALLSVPPPAPERGAPNGYADLLRACHPAIPLKKEVVF